MPGKSPIDVKGVLNTLPKFKMVLNPKSYRMAHPIYRIQDIEHIKPYHHEPEGLGDKIAAGVVRLARGSFDVASRYNPDKMNERCWLNRMIFLETVAGVPGMVGAMWRHLHSIRRMEHDHGWIHHLLQEAENERMHLFIFLNLRNPGIFMRLGVAGAQFFAMNVYSIAYLLFPKYCHRFVGYLEEEAVHTYTIAVKALDDGKLPLWNNMKPPLDAIEYYELDPKTATMRDVLLSIRADEAVHRSVNHHFSDIPQFYDVANDHIHISDYAFDKTNEEEVKQIQEGLSSKSVKTDTKKDESF